MKAHISELNPRQRPPESLRTLYKVFQKLSPQDLHSDSRLVDLSRESIGVHASVRHVRNISQDDLRMAFESIGICQEELPGSSKSPGTLDHQVRVNVYEAVDLPGLFLLPQLLPQDVQICLLEKLLHRDLSNSDHFTNLSPHYCLPYDLVADRSNGTSAMPSFFELPQQTLLQPKNPSVHKPLAVQSMLGSKLRWTTLGGQYDWTEKQYPSTEPPAFPADLAKFLARLFPQMTAEAAIVNLYSPGDTLSIHRDVSEDCDRGLVSISIGCDAVFMIGDEVGSNILPLLVRSGDAILMDGASRFAWHGIPKVLRDTCPEWLRSWPASDTDDKTRYAHWRGWMETKRINLNVRQMRERPTI